MIHLLEMGKRILNIDESWISKTEYGRRMWCPTQTDCTVSSYPLSARLSIIAALDTDGKVYFALTHSNTDSKVIRLFL